MTNQEDRDAVIQHHLNRIAEHQRHIAEHEANLQAMAPPVYENPAAAEWYVGHISIVATRTFTTLADSRAETPRATIADGPTDHTYQLCAALIAAKNWRENQ